MTATLSLVPGTTIGGHYVIGSLINRGGFGAVYRGIDTSAGRRPCAIKETYDVTPAARRQALMEAAVLFTINSSHLPQVYDAFEDCGRFYLVMQLIEGQNLLEISQQRTTWCSEQEVLYWLLPITEVLNELHSRHPAVMHRDIKPGNIIITPDQTAVLVDFGLTKLYDPDSDTQTNVRAVSEGFSPVEQYVGRTCPQSDIYALAATLYFMLTGHVPPASVQRSVHDTLIPPRKLNPRISPHVEQALLTALALNADYRYASMRDFAAALQSPQAPVKLAQPSQSSMFNGYADRTIAGSRIEGGPAARVVSGQAWLPIPPTLLSSPIAPPSPYPQLPPAPRQVRQKPVGRAGQRPLNRPGRQAAGPTASQAPSPAYPLLPQQPKVASPAPVMPNYKRLPGAYNQGCLWGILQGVLSALLVLQNSGYFYVAILEGLLFYLIAGYFTAHKGGSSLRGIWAGFWAGIASTIVFWAVLLSGLLVRLVQSARYLGININDPQSLRDAYAIELQQAVPALFNHPSGQQGGNALVPLIVGLLCAMAVGLLGGLLGTARFRARMRKKGYA
jgi:serine/threonine protein kinase